MTMPLLTDWVSARADYHGLTKAHRWEDAEALREAAVALWPDNHALLIERGLLSQIQMHWADMLDRFAAVRQHVPWHIFGYSRAGEALRFLGRQDEAEAIISSGMELFPNTPELLAQWGLWPVTGATGKTRHGVDKLLFNGARTIRTPGGMRPNPRFARATTLRRKRFWPRGSSGSAGSHSSSNVSRRFRRREKTGPRQRNVGH